MSFFFNMPSELMAALGTVIGFALLGEMDADQENAVGNFLMLIGQILTTDATQAQTLQGRQAAEQQEALEQRVRQLPNAHNKVIPLLTIQILKWQTVPLLTVFPCQYQHLVRHTIVKANAVGDNVIHVHITRLGQPFQLDRLIRIHTASLLFLPQLILDKILSARHTADVLSKVIHGSFVSGGIIVLRLFDLVSFLLVVRQLPRKLDIDMIDLELSLNALPFQIKGFFFIFNQPILPIPSFSPFLPPYPSHPLRSPPFAQSSLTIHHFSSKNTPNSNAIASTA